MLKRYFPFIISALFFLAALFNILHHEMWRDEMQAWLIARDSHSLTELFGLVRYEAQPALWHFTLFFITRLTHNPLFMQLWHILIATISVFLFAKYAPFGLLNRFLFTFGYFIFFEYTTISRNYVLGVLFLILFCLFFTRKNKNFFFVSLPLFFLCLTSIYGLIIALVLSFLVLKTLLTKQNKKLLEPKERISSLILIAFGPILALISFLPPKDFNFSPGWHTNLDWTRLYDSVAIIFNALVPLPEIKYHFWNTNILNPHPLWKAGLGLIIVFIVSLMLIKRRQALFFLLTSTLGIVLFSYFKYFGFIRHWGHIFLIIIAAFWIGEYEPTTPIKNNFIDSVSKKLYSYRKYFITIILLIHFIAGLMANTKDFLSPFSPSKETANYIRKNFDDYTYIGNIDFLVMPLSGYLDRNIYYPVSQDFGSYVIFSSTKRKYIPTADELVEDAFLLKNECGPKILLISSYPLAQDLLTKYNLKYITQSKESIVDDEKYFLYSF